ncbi:MAG: OsmC family protein, partial [Elusimicrobia bacterium]|nr:OsmC family protein [Elusimicrobiota bacterium]
AGFTPEHIQTVAEVCLEKEKTGWTITEVHLDVSARVPKADQAAFEAAAVRAKEGCPVSRLLNAKIGLHAQLEVPAPLHR